MLLYLACHESRFAVQGDGGPESCYLEQWRTFAAAQGERALDQLRKGVEQAISILGTGFISHPGNPQLRLRLANDELRLDDLNRALLRLVYRILFWFVAEDRDALLHADPRRRRFRGNAGAAPRGPRPLPPVLLRGPAPPPGPPAARHPPHRPLRGGPARLRRASAPKAASPSWPCPASAASSSPAATTAAPSPWTSPWQAPACPTRPSSARSAPWPWSSPATAARLRRVDFGNLGAEELGSVYESLLELIPHYDPDNRSYTLTVLPGNERKESGSYYTPTSLVECLLDSALDPLLDEATAHGTAEEKVAALLDLTVCDPACGSGHFLVAAARRIAKRIAAEETGESEPPEPEIRKALRRVVGRCIYGVDINPMAAELAKVSLWLEALEPGKPLSYLDQNIRVGNSLLGVTPALLADGLPDDAFTPIEGDDRKVCLGPEEAERRRTPGPARPLLPVRHPGNATRSWPSAPPRSPTPSPTAWKTCTSISSARPSSSPRRRSAASRSS